MLVIGEVASREVKKDSIVKQIEIIYHPQHRSYIEDTLKLKEEKRINTFMSSYVNDKYSFLLINTNGSASLKKLLQNTFSDDKVFKIANPTINYIFDLLKVRKIHSDIYKWERILNSYINTKEKFINTLKDQDKTVENQIRTFSNNFIHIFFKYPGMNINPYKYKNIDKTLKKDLYNIVTENNKSVYLEMSMPESGYLYRSVWDRYSDIEKINASLERLYVDTLNEFIIPLYSKNVSLKEKDLKELFMRSIMNVNSTMANRWFPDFIIENYKEIMSKFNTGFFKVFINNVKFGDLKI